MYLICDFFFSQKSAYIYASWLSAAGWSEKQCSSHCSFPLSTHVTWLTLTWLKCSWIDNLCKTLSPSASMIVIIIIFITVSDHVLGDIIFKIMWLLCQILGTRKRLNWSWKIVCCLHAEVGRQLTRWSLRMGTLAPNLAHHTAHNGAQWALLILRDGHMIYSFYQWELRTGGSRPNRGFEIVTNLLKSLVSPILSLGLFSLSVYWGLRPHNTQTRKFYENLGGMTTDKMGLD